MTSHDSAARHGGERGAPIGRGPSLSAEAIANLIGGELRGDAEARIGSVAPLGRAGPHDVSFLAHRKYAPLLADSRAGVVLITPELADTPGRPACRIVVPEPHGALLRLLPRLYPPEPVPAGVHPTAVLGPGVVLGRGVSIGAYSVIGAGATLGDRVRLDSQCEVGAGVVIGDDSRLFHAVTLYPGSHVGRRVRLHAGVRIGSDGFGYVSAGGEHQKIPQVGRCIIGDDVEVGANTTIDRGSIDDTTIGAGTKIDNLVQIGHNVRIGQLCLIMAQVGIAGSTHVEDGCVLAGQAGIGGHVTIGRAARIGGQAGVFADVPPGESWSGYPARPHRESLRAQAALFRLTGLVKQLERLVSRDER